MGGNVKIIACSVFKNEIALLQKMRKLHHEVIYLDSMMHMQPNVLEKTLEKELEEQKNHKIVLVYGDCHARMLDIENKNVCKVRGINCCDTLLGKSRYRELRKRNVFILIREWMDRWSEVFKVELGFKNAEIAREFMTEMHTEIVYIDSGTDTIPYDTLEEISDYTGLPYSIEKCDISEFENALFMAIKKVNSYD